MRLTKKLFNDFFERGKGDILLILGTMISLVLAYSSNGEAYQVQNWLHKPVVLIILLLFGSKRAILLASVILGTPGYVWLYSSLKNKNQSGAKYLSEIIF